MPRPRLALWLAGPLCTAALGCTVYSELEGLTRPEAGAPPTDGRTPASDASDGSTSSDRTANDTGISADTPPVDSGNDGLADSVSPPIDGVTRDTASDASGGSDVMIDVIISDSAPDRSVDGAVDVTVPPPADGSADVRVPDVVDAGGRLDADASAPRDADGGPGTVDARDSGPTCWGGTPSTHDEDGDGIVDECDNCPSIANANQADIREVNASAVADGVGDACDPRPTAGGDSIFLFDGLNFTSLPADWTNIGAGSWTASGASVTSPGTDVGRELARNFPSDLSNYLAETAFTFTAVTTDGSSNLPFRIDTARNGWRCVVGGKNGVGQFFLSKVTAGTSETTAPQLTIIDLPQVGDRYRVLGGAYEDNIYCLLGTGERQDRSDTATVGESGFRSSGTTATFEYLLVYRLGGTL